LLGHPGIDSDGAYALHIARPWAEREPVQDMVHLLIRRLFAGRCAGRSDGAVGIGREWTAGVPAPEHYEEE
jgi:hypothetical protein